MQRQPYLLAFPGYHAFPGGKLIMMNLLLRLKQKFFLIMIPGECVQFVGRFWRNDYDIEKGILNDEVFSVNELAETVAPVFAPFRFRTWFYRIDLKNRVHFKADSGEFAQFLEYS